MQGCELSQGFKSLSSLQQVNARPTGLQGRERASELLKFHRDSELQANTILVSK
jgi:hypothetical protein